ncbi:unnamed protein product [Rangifer tarandus platyrhynchus]|uniref:Uncharacterized protein n=1 Tax=Rangifer tarandus platyrhynchus TaxID=3082113 RepID=A0ABN8XRM3_RANTA|nr:unnamed protein product [Rangifer tarandus platyrhynchus]
MRAHAEEEREQSANFQGRAYLAWPGHREEHKLDPGSAARPGNSQGIGAGGRRAGREEGVLGRRRRPARRAVRPAYPERGGAGPRPEEQEEERSESSPGALRDRVPGSGGGGRGSAPAGE